MRNWQRALRSLACGQCRVELRRGDPVIAIAIDGMKRPLFRCGPCAGSPVPPDLPPLVERAFEPIPMTPLRSIASSRLPLDWKQRQVEPEEREPGEEG